MTAPDFRVGDLDRQAAMDRLLTHASAGRLTFAEFDTRAAAAQAARTRNDLDRLFVDLPPIPAGPPAPRRLPARPVTVIATAVIAAVVAGLLVLAAPAFASGMMAGCM